VNDQYWGPNGLEKRKRTRARLVLSRAELIPTKEKGRILRKKKKTRPNRKKEVFARRRRARYKKEKGGGVPKQKRGGRRKALVWNPLRGKGGGAGKEGKKKE